MAKTVMCAAIYYIEVSLNKLRRAKNSAKTRNCDFQSRI